MMTISTLYLCVCVCLYLYVYIHSLELEIQILQIVLPIFLHLEAVVFDRMATDEEKSKKYLQATSDSIQIPNSSLYIVLDLL